MINECRKSGDKIGKEKGQELKGKKAGESCISGMSGTAVQAKKRGQRPIGGRGRLNAQRKEKNAVK